MSYASFRFYGELNDFLPSENKGVIIKCTFEGTPSVKHLVEALGIPHTEVRHLLANNGGVELSYLVQEGDEIEVYPVSICLAGVPELNYAHLSLDDARFILDNHLGRLATYLRMMGFDTLYRNDYQDQQLAELCQMEDRLLLTRDQHLLMRSAIRRGYLVRAKIPRQQLVEVLDRFGLVEFVRPFKRCLRCNGTLQPIPKQDVLDRLQPLTKLYYDEFHICPDCNQVYWKGSHYERMLRLVEGVIQT